MLAVVQFPGSNDDRDLHFALKSVLGAPAALVWHKDAELPAGTRGVLLPGGFSFGDYLRCGAMARHSPLMAAVRRFADSGGPVLGICNGFQVLCEAGLLPGALVRNEGLSFICEAVHVRVESHDSLFARRTSVGEILTIPIKHGEGRYVADASTLRSMQDNGQIALRYCTTGGEVVATANPNGATANIAGVGNETGNVFGMMPHPEHAVDLDSGIRSDDGAKILGSLIDSLAGARA